MAYIGTMEVPRGSITLYIGPMFSSKTSSMINDVERHHIAKKKCVIVKYAKDVRYDHLASSGGIVTHRGTEFARVPILHVDKLADVELPRGTTVIGIDEVQFLPDSIAFIQSWANAGYTVICAGLDSTFQGKLFGHMGELIALSENVTKLKAVCSCGYDASFSKRIAGGTEVEELGGAESYVAVCRICMFNISRTATGVLNHG